MMSIEKNFTNMKNLAVVVVACDKYAFIWDAWWYYFRKYFHVECPVYFISEKKLSGVIKPLPHHGLLVGHHDVSEWTAMLRKGLKSIPEEHMFILMDDHFFNYDITDLFKELYEAFNHLNADALRLRAHPSSSEIYNLENHVQGKYIKYLSQRSDYLVAFSPNIWRRSYLEACIVTDESPWRCETRNHMRHKGYKVLDYEAMHWFTNAIVKGRVTEDGKERLRDYETLKK